MPQIFLDIDIANPARSEHFRCERFLIDSGAVYSVVQQPVLDALGIRPHSRRAFSLANGDEIERDLGVALFRYKDQQGAHRLSSANPATATYSVWSPSKLWDTCSIP